MVPLKYAGANKGPICRGKCSTTFLKCLSTSSMERGYSNNGVEIEFSGACSHYPARLRSNTLDRTDAAVTGSYRRTKDTPGYRLLLTNPDHDARNRGIRSQPAITCMASYALLQGRRGSKFPSKPMSIGIKRSTLYEISSIIVSFEDERFCAAADEADVAEVFTASASPKGVNSPIENTSIPRIRKKTIRKKTLPVRTP